MKVTGESKLTCVAIFLGASAFSTLLVVQCMYTHNLKATKCSGGDIAAAWSPGWTYGAITQGCTPSLSSRGSCKPTDE